MSGSGSGVAILASVAPSNRILGDDPLSSLDAEKASSEDVVEEPEAEEKNVGVDDDNWRRNESVRMLKLFVFDPVNKASLPAKVTLLPVIKRAILDATRTVFDIELIVDGISGLGPFQSFGR